MSEYRSMHQALITGASQGFGRAFLGALVARGWACAVDARDATALNAATAGLANDPLDALRRVYEVDVLAPVALTQLARPALQRAPAPTVVVLSSDAAVEA